jgi:hypothetical protein
MSGSTVFHASCWRTPPAVAADDWFDALDNRRVDGRGERRSVHVLGIHADGPDLWLQVAPSDRPEEHLVLHITPSVTLDDVLRTLRARLDDRWVRHVIHVTPAA